MELNREQVIKALECCASRKQVCRDCPVPQDVKDDCRCMEFISRNVLALIREQAEEIERLNATRYRVSPDGRLEMIPTVESVKADTLKDVQIRFAMHFGTYTDDAEVKVSEVFKLLSKFKEEMLEGEI